MDRLTLVRENTITRCKYKLLFESPLIGRTITVPGVSDGIICVHKSWEMIVRFPSGERCFSSAAIHHSFFEVEDRQSLEKSLDLYKRLLNSDKTAIDLIDDLIILINEKDYHSHAAA